MTTLIERALRSESIERPPIWFMRQAGRILPEYREVRSRVSFLELCGDSDLSLEVTLQPVDRFDLDAAIAFSDILPVVEAIGREVVFEKGHGPKILKPVRSRSDGADLIRPDVADALPVLPETIRKFRAARPNKPILGFAGAPFTLLCYLVEGGGSRNWTHTKTLLWTDPVFAKQLLTSLRTWWEITCKLKWMPVPQLCKFLIRGRVSWGPKIGGNGRWKVPHVRCHV